MRFGIGLALGCVLLGVALGQEKTGEEKTDQEKPGKTAGDAARAFDKAFKQWTSMVREIREIQIQYRVTNDKDRANREKLKTAFDAKMAEAKKLMPEVSRLAEAAFQEKPDNVQLRDFLWQMAVAARGLRDDYEEGLRLTRGIVEHFKPATEDDRALLASMNGFAGLAAFELSGVDLTGKPWAVDSSGKAWSAVELAEKHLNAVARTPQYDTAEMKQQRKDLENEKKYWSEEEAFRKAEDKPEGDPLALPRVRLKTTKCQSEEGDIIIELFENEAPNTVANFIHLVEAGFYDAKEKDAKEKEAKEKDAKEKDAGEAKQPRGTPFHRVIGGSMTQDHMAPAFMAQGGCPKGNGTGGPGWHIPCECYGEKFRRHFRGSVAMAHSGKDTGGSQFYIAYGVTRNRVLDRKFTDDKKPEGHTVFGRVIQGMDVVTQFQRRDPDKKQDLAKTPDAIIKATVLRKRDREYVPKKVEDQVKKEKSKPDDPKKDADPTKEESKKE